MWKASSRRATARPPLRRILRPSTRVEGHLEEVGEGSFSDFAVFAEGFAQEDGGRGVAVGDAFYVHGYHMF